LQSCCGEAMQSAPGGGSGNGALRRGLSMNEESRDQAAARTPNLRQTVGSVLAAAFGVQSGRNRERDFKHGKALHFIIAGIVFTTLFVLTIVVVVKLVLHRAGL